MPLMTATSQREAYACSDWMFLGCSSGRDSGGFSWKTFSSTVSISLHLAEMHMIIMHASQPMRTSHVRAPRSGSRMHHFCAHVWHPYRVDLFLNLLCGRRRRTPRGPFIQVGRDTALFVQLRSPRLLNHELGRVLSFILRNEQSHLFVP